MANKLKTMSYSELLAEREQTKIKFSNSTSNYTRRDLSKYLKRLDQEIGERRKTNGKEF